MRRSSAPSIKKNISNYVSNNSIAINVKENSDYYEPAEITSRILLNKTENNSHVDDKIYYNVVYGKISTKKHKIYQDEGKLIISRTSLILIDLNGKTVGTSMIKKSEILEEGSRICVGSKDVELIEKISTLEYSIDKRPVESENTARPIKKLKQTHFCSPIIKEDNKSTTTNPFSSIQMTDSSPCNQNQSDTRTTTQVLSLLLDSPNDKTKEENIQSIGKYDKENDEICLEDSINGKIYYNVVYGKMSTKKHKTYQNDGKLIVLGTSLILTDLDGKEVDNTVIKKSVILNEGIEITVGNKDVQLIQKILLYNNDIDIENKRISPMKKIKQSQFCKPIICENLDIVKKCLPLKMPDPSFEHQQKYNDLRKPISEVYVTELLTSVLRSHQREGVIFLYECLMGFRSTENGDHFGAILADEMGLGKTLQCITTCYTLLKDGPYGVNIATRILIVTPSSLVDNWDAEVTKWLTNDKILSFVIDTKHKPEQFAAASRIPFMIISYEMFAIHFERIKTIKFDIIICDEGHRLKNCNIKVAMMLNQIECKRRVILTGTPIQNDLHEFYSLINFVNPGILGTYNEYKRYYEIPIVQSQQPTVDTINRELGEERAIELNKIITAFVLRRTQNVINQYLPKKQECIIFCKPSELQKTLLNQVLEYYENKHDYNLKISPLEIITIMKKICNYPSLIKKSIKDDKDIIKYLIQYLPSSDKMNLCNSGKLFAVNCILNELSLKGEKIVIVSYYTKTLDMLMDLANQNNYKYCRLDGTTISTDRLKIVKKFNEKNSNTFIFLLSAKAGGLGLNLIGASRLILYDNDWNPASDLQAMSRIWRDGQKRNVVIYRLITAGTIEEKILQRQISKTSLSDCVVETQHFNNLKLSDEELKDLFTIQNDFEICLTHLLIDCNCSGNGEIPFVNQRQFETELNKIKSLKIHELLHWEHYNSPINTTVLEELCLAKAGDEILFIFKNQSNY